MNKSLVLPFLAVVSLTLACLACAACDPLDELEKVDFGDMTAPVLLSHSMDFQGTVNLGFDEPVILEAADLELQDGLKAWTGDGSTELVDTLEGQSLSFRIKGDLAPGTAASMALNIRDASGNILRMILPFYGPNPSPARVMITEIAAKSSKTILDALELQVLEGGNLGGLTVCLGFPEDFDSRFIFPALEAVEGDRIILHFKRESTSQEEDELVSKTQSGGLNSHPGAWDFWHPEAPGLPDSSGVISVSLNPLGPLQDAVFYTDKVTVEGKAYRSFGTAKLLRWAEYAQAAQAWTCAAALIAVEDGASSEALSATRTLCRREASADSNGKSDWYVCPTGGISLGTANTASDAPAKRNAPANQGISKSKSVKTGKSAAGKSGSKAKKSRKKTSSQEAPTSEEVNS